MIWIRLFSFTCNLLCFGVISQHVRSVDIKWMTGLGSDIQSVLDPVPGRWNTQIITCNLSKSQNETGICAWQRWFVGERSTTLSHLFVVQQEQQWVLKRSSQSRHISFRSGNLRVKLSCVSNKYFKLINLTAQCVRYIQSTFYIFCCSSHFKL